MSDNIAFKSKTNVLSSATDGTDNKRTNLNDRKTICTILNIKRTENTTLLDLSDGKTLSLHPHVYAHRGDKLEVFSKGGTLSQIHKQVHFAPVGSPKLVKIYPPYYQTELLHIPPHTLKLTIRERLSAKDWREAKLLEKFHYRGQGLNKLVGRRTVLIIEEEKQGIVGYGVLSSTVAAARPRFALLGTNFTAQMKSKLINQIARIPRVVIHPEFRGIGLGILLAKHLATYAKEYWDISGYKPIMIEVIASMTEYHNFFQQAGFTKVGTTLGYAKGIQPDYGSGSWEARPNHNTYNFLRNQRPKPYLVYPISNEVVNMIKEKGLSESKEGKLGKITPQLKKPIRFKNASVVYKARNGLTPRAEEVRNAFGVDSQQMYSPILNRFSLNILPGEVVLFTGASGSGKSTIIKLLTQSSEDIHTTMETSGDIIGLDCSQISRLDTSCDEHRPLIELVGNSTKEAIAILNGVGLAEAHLYLKRCSQISEGQRYRFAVARLCDSGKPIWIADEFASGLDPQTAAIVAKGIRKLAMKQGATVILASPHISNFVGSLLPNKLIYLRWGGQARIYSAWLYCRRLGKEISIWCKNNGKEILSKVVVEAITEHGVHNSLLTVDKLEKGDTTDKIQLRENDLNNYLSIVMNCQEGVGDQISLM